MQNALWITIIGMGLVFVAILALWGLMALLVRVTAQPESQAEAPAPADDAASAPEAGLVPDGTLERKRRAAAVAVAVTLALTARQTSSPNTIRDMNAVSAWQAIQRATQLEQRSNVTRRKVIR